jgi:L,D-transpeptidase catalytic domain
VGSQGSSNVSHGCVNLSPADAQTYYNLSVPGDPITITGSTKAGKWDDGWTEWFLPWQQFVEGSALHEAVKAGPDGSSFVNPPRSPPPAAVPRSRLRRPATGHPARGWQSSGPGAGPQTA